MALMDDVVKAIKRNDAEMATKRKEYAELEDKLNQLRAARSKGYQNDAEINNVCNRRTALKMEIRELAAKAKKEAYALCDAETARLEALDAPKTEELTDDVRLLNSGLKLSARELTALAQKDENKTPTMSRLIQQYADEHKIALPPEGRFNYTSHGKEISNVQHVKNTCEYFEKWLVDGCAEQNINSLLRG